MLELKSSWRDPSDLRTSFGRKEPNLKMELTLFCTFWNPVHLSDLKGLKTFRHGCWWFFHISQVFFANLAETWPDCIGNSHNLWFAFSSVFSFIFNVWQLYVFFFTFDLKVFSVSTLSLCLFSIHISRKFCNTENLKKSRKTWTRVRFDLDFS